MRIRMVAEHVTFLVPIAEKPLSFGLIDPHSTHEQCDFESALGEEVQETAISFMPSHERTDVNARVVHCNRHLRASAVGLRERPFRHRIGEYHSGTRNARQLRADCCNSGCFEEVVELAAIHARSIYVKLLGAEKTHQNSATRTAELKPGPP